jgi:hypothetical protein
MTDLAVATTTARDADAGTDLARQLCDGLGAGTPPDVVIVFASSSNGYQALLGALQAESDTRLLVGCSSAGEFSSDGAGTGLSSAIALRAPEMRFSASLARNMSADRERAAHDLVAGFEGLEKTQFQYRTAMVFVDALAGYAEDLLDRLTVATVGMYRFVGGGAGDDGAFKQTHVFCGTEAATNAAVALEILSNKPIGIGARHGWQPASDPFRVTESADSCVLSLNVSPAVEAFEEHATATSQAFDREQPLPFFLNNIVGVKSEEGHKLRVPLGVEASGGVTFAAELPVGSTAHIMSTGAPSAAAAAASAMRDAIAQVEGAGHRARGALFFDCVATRLRLGKSFENELDAVGKELGDVPFVGFNSYGQIVRADGQFSGFHNCTAVACVIPE